MDTKARIRELMEARGWTIYELAKRSGLAQTTLANMWKRNTEPTIPSLQAICGAFGMTLAQFFSEGSLVELTEEQSEFFRSWSALTPEQRDILMRLVRSMR